MEVHGTWCKSLESGSGRKTDILKAGLSGIVKRYGFHTVHIFYKAYADYHDKAANWEEIYGQNTQKESVHERLKNYQKEMTDWQLSQQLRIRAEGEDKVFLKQKGQKVLIILSCNGK